MTNRITATAEFPVERLTALAFVFALRRNDDGTPAGAAVVCPEARYASVHVPGASRLKRRFATPAEWKAIEAELAAVEATAGAGVKAGLSIQRLISGETIEGVTAVLQRVEFIEATPGEMVAALDGLVSLEGD